MHTRQSCLSSQEEYLQNTSKNQQGIRCVLAMASRLQTNQLRDMRLLGKWNAYHNSNMKKKGFFHRIYQEVSQLLMCNNNKEQTLRRHYLNI